MRVPGLDEARDYRNRLQSQLSNLLGEIKRVEQRIETLETLKEDPRSQRPAKLKSDIDLAAPATTKRHCEQCDRLVTYAAAARCTWRFCKGMGS